MHDQEVDRGRVGPDHSGAELQGFDVRGENVLMGTSQGGQSITGSPTDDLIVSGGVTAPESPQLDQYGNQLEYIDGRAGYDTVIMKGSREDFLVSIPGVGEYPEEKRYEEDPDYYTGRKFLYGSTIHMTDVRSNTTFVLQDVERVGFDGKGYGQYFFGDGSSGGGEHTPQADVLAYLSENQQSGNVTYTTTDQLRREAESGMTPDEIKDARLASTIEATRAVRGMPGRYSDEGLAPEQKQQVLDAAAAAHPDIMDYKPNISASTTGHSMDPLLGLDTQPQSAPVAKPQSLTP